MVRPFQKEIPLPSQIIHDSQRLVPKNFVYTSEMNAADVVRRGVDRVDENGRRYKGYPQEGLRLTPEELAEEERSGTLSRRLVGTPSNRPPYFVDHPGRYKKDGTLDEHAIDVRKLPLKAFRRCHDYYREMLTQSIRGVFTGPAYYWQLGPWATSDVIILNLYTQGQTEKVDIAGIYGKDRRGLALIGGDKNKDKSTWETVVHEAQQEAGVSIRKRPRILVGKKIIVPDWRASIHSWPVTDAYVVVLDEREGRRNTPLRAGKEEIKADWVNLTAENIEKFTMHANIIRQGLIKAEEKWGIVVSQDGIIGKAA